MAFDGFPVDRTIDEGDLLRPRRIGLGWSDDGRLALRFEDPQGRAATIELWCAKIVESLQERAAKALEELHRLAPEAVDRGKVIQYDPMVASQGAALLKACEWFIAACQGDSDTGESHWKQFPEYRAARVAVAAAKGEPIPTFIVE